MKSSRSKTTLDLVGHLYVGRLGLAVAYEWVVGFLLEIVIIEADWTTAVAEGTDRYHSGWKLWSAGGKQPVFQKLEEQEVGQMIGAKLGFEAVFRPAFWCCHDAAVC